MEEKAPIYNGVDGIRGMDGNGGITGLENHPRPLASRTTLQQMTRPKARYHTTASAAERLQISEITVRKWCQDQAKRAILHAWKPDGHWKIPFDHFERMAERAEATGGSLFA